MSPTHFPSRQGDCEGNGSQVLLCCGMLMALLVDWMLLSLPGAWRWMVAAPIVPALFMSGVAGCLAARSGYGCRTKEDFLGGP